MNIFNFTEQKDSDKEYKFNQDTNKYSDTKKTQYINIY